MAESCNLEKKRKFFAEAMDVVHHQWLIRSFQVIEVIDLQKDRLYFVRKFEEFPDLLLQSWKPCVEFADFVLIQLILPLYLLL